MTGTVTLARNRQQTLVNGATGTGTSQSASFNKGTVISVIDDGILQCQAITTGTFSALVFTLQLSSDGGVTWSQVGATWDAVSLPVQQFQVSEAAVDSTTGLPVAYRFLCSTFSGGTSVTVKGWISPLGPVASANGPTSDVTAFQGGSWTVGISGSGNTAVVTSAGALKVDGSAVTQPVEDVADGIPNATAPTDALQIGVQDRTGKLQVPTSDARGSANAIAVEIVDASGNQITTFGSGGTQYTGSPAVSAAALVSTATSGYDGANVRPLLTSNTGQLHIVADSGSTTTVTGTVAVTQSTSPWVVSLASTTVTGSVAVTNAGVFAVQDSLSHTYLATLAACISGSPPNAIAVAQSTNPWTITGTVAQGQAAASTAPWYMRYAAPTTANWSQAAISFSSSGDNTIVAASGSTTIRIMRMFFVNCDATNNTNIIFKDSTPTNFSGAFTVASAGGSFNGTPSPEPLYTTAAGKAFVINSSAAVQISGTVWFVQS